MAYLFLSLGAFFVCVFLFFALLYGGRSIAQGKSIRRKKSIKASSVVHPEKSKRIRIHIPHVPQETPCKKTTFDVGADGLDNCISDSDSDDVFCLPVSQSCLTHLTKTRITQSPSCRRRSPSSSFIREFSRHADKFSTKPIVSH